MDYWLIFYVALAVNVCVTIVALLMKFLGGKSGKNKDDDPSASQLPRYSMLTVKYLATYLLATFSDWLQGPYVYAVYSAYGFSERDIKILFVAGFASSKLKMYLSWV